METLTLGLQTAKIDQGELISYQVDGYEFMHLKGDPGWGHSDAEMFPIIGPTEEAGYRVQVPRGNAIQDQHGLLRELPYTLEESAETYAAYVKIYKAGTLVGNSKYPDRSRIRQLLWPFSFQFRKHFELTPEGLKITFTIKGDRDMPYMLGYHPAFVLRTPEARVVAPGKSYALKEVMAAGNRAVEVAETDTLILEDQQEIVLKTKGFGHFMLWSPSANMICVEPITFYPYSVEQPFLHEGFRFLEGENTEFEVLLIPKIKNGK